MEQKTFLEFPRELMEQYNSYTCGARKDTLGHPNLQVPVRPLRMPYQEGQNNVFKFPRDIRELNEVNSATLRHYMSSPRSSKDSNVIFGENSDWMIAERMKSRTPPSSPQTPSSHQGNVCRASSPTIRIEEKDLKRSKSPDEDIIRCVPNRMLSDDEDEIDHSSNVQKTPAKTVQDFQDLRSPFRSVTKSPRPMEANQNYSEVRMSDSKQTKSMIQDSLEQLHRELDRRSARKQLNFDLGARSTEFNRDIDDMYYNANRSRSPKLRRSSCDSDEEDDDSITSGLISQLLNQLQSKKRKLSDRSDRCRCEYEEECESRDAFKRRRKDPDQYLSPCYSRQREIDTSLYRQQPEVQSNCTCAVMEKQFMKMAENAYKNIRRQDDSSESFAQFRRELSETNNVLKDSIVILQQMKNVCDHRRIQ
ncbi:hypothetical protein FSP39_023291 [Pinctada imbricata]|uniref:Uncharacterized protein n=1 Tax=Pinctada imbricata TaxID=66713 RepID=A0AA89BVM4_PINIB|nr:hypothetical protein FSP39_023291 [Pinctada imbricata]